MIRLVHIFKHYYLGISIIGIIAFAIQEIPYMIMPLIKPESNPIMNMQNNIRRIEILQSIVGVLTMVLLMTLVRDDVKAFSLSGGRDKLFFGLTTLMIVINFIGWAFYYTGHQYGWLIVISQFAAVPLYYLFFGLWKYNYLMVGTASVFFLVHTFNGCWHFLISK